MLRRIALTSLVIAAPLAAAPALADAPGNPGTVQFKGASFPIEESAGEVVVIVRRHGGSSGEVSVDFETFDGSALAGEDYTATAGTLVWGDGDGADKTVPIEILVDDVGEPLETFSVMLSNPVGGVAIGAVATTVVRIKPHDGDDDGGGGGGGGETGTCIKLRSSTFPAFESAGEATFVVERGGDGAGEASVDYLTIDGSAVAGEDYLPVSGTLVWPDGVVGEMSVPVPLIDDEVAEGDETISVIITNAVGGTLGCQDTASIVVVDDDGGGEGACVPDEETLCLAGGRFALQGSWSDFQGGQGAFRAVPSTDQAGLFWFFDARNIEVMVKVLDGCALNGHRWVFLAATTNVGYTLEVTDLATGAVKSYINPLGTRAPATTDVEAFPCTP
ncbi:MAG: hypothetical protein KDB94_04270 [Acidobacteria bacterium]|nr:hypothetical protein [Acidobacteriota bacterium]